MLATTRVTLAPVASSVAQRRPAGRARVASPKRPAGLIGALRNRAIDSSKPRRAHRVVVARAAPVNPALGDVAAPAAPEPADARRRLIHLVSSKSLADSSLRRSLGSSVSLLSLPRDTSGLEMSPMRRDASPLRDRPRRTHKYPRHER